MEGHKCETEGCSNPSRMVCPTCKKQGLPSAYFCSQEHFKQSWNTHKLIHKPSSKTFDPFPADAYTGKLRAVYPLTPRRPVPSHIARPDYVESGTPWSERETGHLIRQLSPAEIEGMRKACKIGREVLDIAAKAAKVGATTDEIDRVAHEACIERDTYPSPLNYWNFPKSCCTSVNEVICHGIPDQYELQDGDIVNIDISTYHNGFHGDLNETYLVGNVDDAGRKLVNVTRECMNKAIEMVRPGVLYRDVGNIIQKHAHANGLSVVRTYCGHGINNLFHCAPSIPHYAKNKAVGAMKPGHTFTIEPMICEGKFDDKQWPDKWTAVTRDGKRSAQFEQTLLVTETGVEILTI
ncbi:hypothetical protein SmJEL517_g02311 [Synchytrium microbalum]|uniref:Methionine aminopeptidase n=1 Tax=Synchytrium microbalum TaxID=1806994 RepID=A0A507C6R4_9FUNG|nr:uncharacterized protein SmJEL517_g02311 [Synchytrium microbalum]TPX35312.1 hypothetical protein SmJEL517_g02311 [Synchytrium microbalum]